MPPQVTPDGGYENFTAKSDIFSLGMILYFMCFGNLPYLGADMVNEENENLDTLREEIMAWPGLGERTGLRPDLPERLYQSLKALISPDPSVRPTAEEILMGIEMQEGAPSVRIKFADFNSYLSCWLMTSSAEVLPPHRKSQLLLRTISVEFLLLQILLRLRLLWEACPCIKVTIPSRDPRNHARL